MSESTTALDRLNDPLAVPADPAPIGRTTRAPCPLCGVPAANLRVDLWRLGDDSEPTFSCEDCGGDFSVADVRNFIAKWGKLLGWLAAAPDLG